ncbi:MAG: hypothetical protein CVV27_07140 [Candidatus Melainabacteria bacterium HGW-Melainabacteria-1]|nr:MAG: hypothetical protein CVV27_07140 [Candidatus Melainabacteria bacterium HGW-Melainabacteria-1]
MTGSQKSIGHLKITPFQSHEISVDWPGAEKTKPLQTALPGPPLYEQTSYRVSLKALGSQQIAIQHADPDIQARMVPLDPLTPDVLVGELNFRSQVGYSNFEVWVDGQKDYAFEVEVYPSKLQYKEDFEQMLAEVQEILAGLAFEYLRSTYLGASTRQTEQQTPLEWVLLFQHILNDLEAALRQIAQSPIRSLHRQNTLLPLHQIRKVDGSLRQAIRTGRGTGPQQLLANGVRAREQHWAQQVHYTLDTPEHRWIAGQLQRIRQKLSQILLEEKARIGHRPDQIERLTSFERRLAQLQNLEPLMTAGLGQSPGFTSLQLMGASGYREAYRAILALQLGLRVEGNALNLSLKNIAELYEYWCYLAMVRLLAETCEETLPLNELIDIQQSGLKVRLRQGQETRTRFRMGNDHIDLLYNPHLRQNALLTHKPDILLEVRKPHWPVIRAVLDAKYRIDATESTRAQMGLPAPPQDAINVLHRYRDAILDEEHLLEGIEPPMLARSVIQGLALYPYVVQNPQEFPQSRLHKYFKRIGIGAIPLVPTQTDYLSDWLKSFIAGQPWELAQTNFPAALQPALRQAASEGVLIGTLRGDYAREHLAWTQQTKSYYIPYINPAHGRQWRLQWIALYLPKELRPEGIGAVALRGRIKQIEVIERDAIQTAWPSGRSQQRVILYQIEAWEEMKPIPNTHELATAMTQNRWSTRLGLECASHLSELLLETVPEWQLYERLKQENIPFRIKAGKVPRLEEDSPGHACFEIDTGVQIRYQGSQGFELASQENRSLKPSVEKTIKAITHTMR